METVKIVNGDLEFDELFRIKMVSGEEKLSQIINEILLIERMENGFGSGLINVSDVGMVKDVIVGSVERFKELCDMSEYVREDSELVYDVEDFVMNVVGTDVFFSLAVRSKRKVTVETRGQVLVTGG